MSRRAVDALGQTVASLPPRPANLVEVPDLHCELAAALSKMGVERLYSHQREAYERVRAGENVVVATATASGKSLCFKIPAFENALMGAASRALLLYPTKALAQDQLGKIRSLGLRSVRPATYDGDTPQAIRADVRRRANIVLTNPDMLNIGILPNHEAWADFLRNLRIVAVEGGRLPRGLFCPRRRAGGRGGGAGRAPPRRGPAGPPSAAGRTKTHERGPTRPRGSVPAA